MARLQEIQQKEDAGRLAGVVASDSSITTGREFAELVVTGER